MIENLQLSGWVVYTETSSEDQDIKVDESAGLIIHAKPTGLLREG